MRVAPLAGPRIEMPAAPAWDAGGECAVSEGRNGGRNAICGDVSAAVHGDFAGAAGVAGDGAGVVAFGQIRARDKIT